MLCPSNHGRLKSQARHNHKMKFIFRRSMLLVLWRCRWRPAPDHAAHIEEEHSYA